MTTQDITKLEALYSSSRTSQNGKKQAEPGTVIHGTHREEDIIPACMHLLFALDRDRARQLWQKEPKLLEALCDKEAGIENDWWQTEDCFLFMAEDLFDIMQEYAPEGYYFGSHIGDGSDFGYWQNEDEDKDVL